MSENDHQEMEVIPTLTLLNGNTIRILTPGKYTDNRLTVIDYVDFTRGNPPPFTRHEFIEVFTVLEGRLAFQYLGESVFYVSAGDAVTVPSGLSHTFWNPDEQASHIMLACTPAGLDRFFEAIHREMERLTAGEIEKAEIGACMERLRVEHGIEETAAAPDIS
ncbi:MAG: cupin domain-containing protein [Gammaproteobacteria bacterium]|jgi:mannose-6-phosphate isomerase-like protein (cupin superfamily)|nr:cupin domain-containing protein [Gammaproteobacteria bacterium]